MSLNQRSCWRSNVALVSDQIQIQFILGGARKSPKNGFIDVWAEREEAMTHGFTAIYASASSRRG